MNERFSQKSIGLSSQTLSQLKHLKAKNRKSWHPRELTVPTSPGLDGADSFFFVLLGGTAGFHGGQDVVLLSVHSPQKDARLTSLCVCSCLQEIEMPALLKRMLASIMRSNIQMLMNRKGGIGVTLYCCERVSFFLFLKKKTNTKNVKNLKLLQIKTHMCKLIFNFLFFFLYVRRSNNHFSLK